MAAYLLTEDELERMLARVGSGEAPGVIVAELRARAMGVRPARTPRGGERVPVRQPGVASPS